MAESKPLRNARYISLETYRRTGQAVRTPVWFVSEAGRLYCYSEANAGKVKRIRNNPRVALAPSDSRGRVNEGATWLQGSARILPDIEAQHAHKLLRAKYGWQRRILDFFWLLGGRKPRAAIEITLD